ncbi:MAG: RNA polymerase sigma factor [Candidatus Gastranaerophilales bacterium]|nr:RNA polymerase sigma factor [Candidatus Gastranaerophilales bacterium]
MNASDFNEIYALYFQDVYKFLLALCHNEEIAEELTQDTFFKAMKNYKNFRGDCKIVTWLCQIAKHSFFLYDKHRKRNVELEGVFNEIADDTDSIEIMLGQKEQAFEIHKLLHDLPEPYKEVFSLRVLGELSFRDIAKLFDKTESWARVTFHRAKWKLIEQIEEENHG